jgi:hypothetical protein
MSFILERAMRKFEYRSPRYDVDLAVRLIAGSADFTGRCRQISRDGLSAQFPKQLPPGSQGTLLIHFQDLSVEVRVRVAHAGANAEGLEFLFRSETDRKAVDQLIAAIAVTGQKLGPVLVK